MKRLMIGGSLALVLLVGGGSAWATMHARGYS
jgi:hypothetical protein